jgi:hypothetical protein
VIGGRVLPVSLFHHYESPHLVWGRNDTMGDGSDYPSPRSEAPHGVNVASALASATESLSSIARMNEQQQAAVLGYASVDGSRPRLSVRRARDPPKNAEGQIYCDHTDCQAAPPTFRRPCEWK